jgi:signal transduction histidine kinase
VGRHQATSRKPVVKTKRDRTSKTARRYSSSVADLREKLKACTKQLNEAIERENAAAEVLRVISSSPTDVQPTFEAIAESARRLCNAANAMVFRFDGKLIHLAAYDSLEPEQVAAVRSVFPIRPGRESITARAILTRASVHVRDRRTDPELQFGVLSMNFPTTLSVPLLHDGTPLGAITVTRTKVAPFSDRQVELVQTFADQAVIAIENVRLFDEIQNKSRELEIASQHKSQFVANMSHELRTPLAAMLGYAELMQEGIYEPLGQKSLAALVRIRSNGKHLLGLINTVLDIAKIESGQFTLNMTEYSIETVVETVRSATESLAQNKKLALTTAVAKSLPIGIGDEQRLTQVLLNLVGNAIKFTDTGEVRVTAEAADGHFAISVVDTGPGIPEQERTRIFEQFHQVDDSSTKTKGGTGLGLAIAKQIVEMHGGNIWVESILGQGSTFHMKLPVRADYQKPIQ